MWQIFLFLLFPYFTLDTFKHRASTVGNITKMKTENFNLG